MFIIMNSILYFVILIIPFPCIHISLCKNIFHYNAGFSLIVCVREKVTVITMFIIMALR